MATKIFNVLFICTGNSAPREPAHPDGRLPKEELSLHKDLEGHREALSVRGTRSDRAVAAIAES